ncbi:MAG: hypothetical protein GEU28_00930 [Dehalococcoidia bacterium]|nr:hypothetical protein [Dehalococcoidia bacterium]
MAEGVAASPPPGRLQEIFDRLLARYGPQDWWPGDSPLEVAVGAILTQSASWVNVDRALRNLETAGILSVRGLREVPEAALARLVFPAGYFNAKARKIKAFIAMLDAHFEGRMENLARASGDELRRILLTTHGVGPETADAIVLYAAGQPTFVIDAYTRRIFGRLNLVPAVDTYEAWRGMMMAGLRTDAELFNEYHALLVRHGKDVCRKSTPICDACPLLDLCPAGHMESLTAGQRVATLRAP